MGTKFRNVCFTSFQQTITFDQTKIEYICWGIEICPTTKKEHLQGTAQFKTPLRLKGCQKAIGDPKCHIENMHGTIDESIKYCKKDGQFFEWGNPRRQGGRTDLITLKKKVLNTGKMSDEIIDSIQNYQQLKFAENLLKYSKAKRTWKPKVTWIYGPSGVGKSNMAFSETKDPWVSGKNLKWWDGYNGQEDIIIDDFRADFCTFHELLRILDKYEYRVEIKGRSCQLLAKNIYITSCHHPEDVYNTREDITQLLRRIDTIIYINGYEGTGTKSRGNTVPLTNPFI